MAAAGQVIATPASGGAGPSLGARVLLLRVGIIVALLGIWEAVAASGLLFRDVVPSLVVIARAVWQLVGRGEFYHHLGITAAEVFGAVAIGSVAGLLVGIALGANRFLARAYEAFIYYLGPTPKIIFFPIMIMWFGVGSGSKVAMGVLSCFFPIVVSAAGGMREIDSVLIRVGRSFRLTTAQMITKIYLPAMRTPVVNGIRLGLGVAIIGTLLAETKLSNRGLGYLIIQAYAVFDMPRMYALLAVLFVLAIGVNALIGRLAVPRYR